MTELQFRTLLPKLQQWTDFLYFHIMGEPLCHPDLELFLQLAHDAGFRVILTTNGTLLSQKQNILKQAPGLHMVNISLHAFEANDLAVPFQQYLHDCFSFGKALEGQKLIVYRLWNQGGAEELNDPILQTMENFFPKPWKEVRQGYAIGDRVFLEYGEKFDWPDLSAPEGNDRVFCYGLKDQIGILCDGSVVPCCLDHDGDLALGNLFHQELKDILDSPKAQGIAQGFANRVACEELCRKCGYARRF